MENKKIVKQFIENLTANQVTAYEVFDENVRASWPGTGMEISGKEELVKFFKENGHNEIVSQETKNLLEDGDMICGNGVVTTEKNGKKQVSHFADFYTVKNGRITELVSYVITEK